MTSGLCALVLAAGAGRRFGGGKLLAPYGEGRLLDRALASAFASPAEAVILVTGADARAVSAAARRFQADARCGAPKALRLVHAADHEEGMAASLRAGIRAVPEAAAAAFVFLGDMPRVPQGMAAALVEALDGALAAAPVHQGRRGHPVLFGRPIFPDLLALTGDKGAKALLDRLGPRLALVETDDPGVLFDVDVRGDLER
jgi:molybdenum cofactor cytidylyltransferase